MQPHTERAFEDYIENHLITQGGYHKGDATGFDAELGLFPDDIFTFFEKTQANRWQVFQDLNGARSKEIMLIALGKELAVKGALYILRHGFKCYGRKFHIAYFQPNSGLNPQAIADYQNTILTVTRQVYFNPKNRESIDMVLAVNGLPVATLELKNQMTGQNVENAKEQYKNDRDPNCPLFKFKERALVHFAVDTDNVFMTTKLNGAKTVFLPFNKGRNFGAGNPRNTDGSYPTAYLWEEVLTKDSLMDILARFLHLQVDKKQTGGKTTTTEAMIFPRYHQLDVVRDLIADAVKQGAGHNYLIQHSAGSGKSNSIAWLAHRLSSLHDANDKKIFDTVVVVTDRRVLDQQLQNTIYQFEHAQGVVERIDENTQQLARALSSGVPIVITTIQKFPFIAQALDALEKKDKAVKINTKGKQFAVIVDEAHSSQSGETAMELRKVLNKDGIAATVAAQMMDETDDDNLSDEAKRKVLEQAAKRKAQPNLSFFAFTATPKFKTLAVFNEAGKTGQAPFHLYSMRQAIQEKFIMNVLASYTTYNVYFGLIKTIPDDPSVPKRKAAQQLARFMSLHPHNIAQKIEVIVEHFRAHVRHKIGGRAKAMVVTSSRLAAVQYKLALDKYIADKGYTNLRALVAFSGSVTDPDFPDKHYTEVGMNNGIKESELPEKFTSDQFQVLLVAEKYQTGFDQPLLHTMYVDKRLAGIQAVQTLSRLNRMMDGKDDTFVLDFVNDHEDIRAAFKDYYEMTGIDEIPDAQRLYSLQHDLAQQQVFTAQEVDTLCEIFFKRRKVLGKANHQRMTTTLDAAVARYESLEEDEQEIFKNRADGFRKVYAFLSQIIPYHDSELEKLYTYLRFLIAKLPWGEDESPYQLGDAINLQYYRLQQNTKKPIDLDEGDADPLLGPTDTGTRSATKEDVQLSALVIALNDRFGTEFGKGEDLFFGQIVADAVVKEELVSIAKVNSQDNFAPSFNKELDGLCIKRMDKNAVVVDTIMNDPAMKDLVKHHLAKQVYGEIRGTAN
ncbi:MAG: type I restriction endonuclease subunit R [Candidatus Halichondribacter symbioticus]